MLAVRVIPVLLKRHDSLVKGVGFDSWRSVGHPLQAARIHATRSVDELLYLDIAANGPDVEAVQKLTKDAFIPVTVGGGVRTVQDVNTLLRAGADKVAVCTHAEKVIPESYMRFGRQAIVAGIDVLDGKVAFRCGKEATDKTPVEWALRLESIGAGEILLQSVERDGTMEGYDLDLIGKVSAAVKIPVIASCGCGTYEHMAEAIKAGASAVAAGAMFQFTDLTPKGAAEFLSQQGIPARV